MSKYSISNNDKNRLRMLAARQMEIATSDEMKNKQKLWYDVNDGIKNRPPFAIETGTFNRDFMPDGILECEGETARGLEYHFLSNIRHHEIINDDWVLPDYLPYGWMIEFDEYGIQIETDYVKDSEGKELGYHFHCPITDLSEGFDMIKPSTFSIDRSKTYEYRDFLTDLFADIIPVRLRYGSPGLGHLTQRLMRLLSMETFFMGMYDSPENLHGIMALLRDNCMRLDKWAEDEGMLTLNNEQECTCGTCLNFTTNLPRREIKEGDKVLLSDLWKPLDSQETVGVSAELFHEFCFPYYRDIAATAGYIYWGCCEPADPIWEMSLSKLPNLRAVSISKWADENKMSEYLSNTEIVYSRKPDPTILGVNPMLDEDEWRGNIRSTLEATNNNQVQLEFVVRDVYSMHGNLGKAKRATEIAYEEINKFY